MARLPVFGAEPPRISQWVAAIEERKHSLSDPIDIERVDRLIEHLVAEDERDVERTMATIADDGVYHAWGGTRTATADKAEQKVLYEAVYAENPDAFNLTLEIERFFVGADGVCMDGVLHKEVGRDALAGMRLPVPADAEDGDLFVVSRRQALFVSYVDGLMRGEDLYWDEGAAVSRLAARDESIEEER